MAIDLLEYMHDYAMGPANGEWEAMTKKQQNAELARPDALPKTFTVDGFLNDLICSGGIELHEGRCAPKFR